MRTLVLIGALLFLTAGCGAGGEDEPARPAAPPPPPPPAEAALYEATATVLEAPGQGPMLCLGAIALSLPPQCGDVPIAGWSWDAVEGEQRASGVTWGEFRVVGAYDGETFRLVEAGPPEAVETEPDEATFTPACPEPEGGWVVPETGRTNEDEIDAADAYARRRPDYVASWIVYLEDKGAQLDAGNEAPLPVVYNAVFTGDAARHEAEIRKVWDGALCVVEREAPSAREARRIRAEAESSLDELGLQMLASWEGPVGRAAEIEVVADPGGAGQAALDERFGPGLVRLVPRLRPVG